MSAADGLNLARQWAVDAATRQHQALADAWAAKQQAQQEAQWGREDQAAASLNQSVDRYSADPTDRTGDFAQQYGLTPRATVTPTAQGGYNQRQGFYPTENGDSPGMGLSTPGADPQFKVDPRRQSYVDDLKTAGLRRDFTGASAAKRQLDAMDMGSQAAMIQNRVLNAPDDVVASFAQKYTDSAHIPGSMMTDPKTGMTKLTLDNGKVIPMNKAQLATYVTGLWKIDQGDPTGSADLASVDKTLQDLGDKRFGQMGTMAKDNNEAQHYDNQLQLGRENIASQERSYRYMYGATRGGAGGSGGKAVSPETTAAMNDIVVKFQNETDPKARAQLERQYNMLQGQAANQLGKPMQLRTDKPAMDPVDTKEYRTAMLGLDPRPSAKVGWFGGKDDTAGKAWDARRDNINAIYGVQGAPDTGGQGNKLPVVADPGRSQGGSAAPMLGGQSGSHAPMATGSTENPNAAELADINMRLNLAGVDPTMRMSLMDRRNQLTGNSGMFGMQPRSNGYTWLGGAQNGLGSGTDFYGQQ